MKFYKKPTMAKTNVAIIVSPTKKTQCNSNANRAVMVM